MSTSSETRRPIVDANVIRRTIHIVLFLGIIVGIRACGGAGSAEDRLGAGTQWFAEKTGLTAVKERWDKSIRPPIAAMTSSASESLYQGLARSLERASLATDQTAAFAGETANKSVDAVAGMVRRFLYGAAASSAQPQQNGSRPQQQSDQAEPR